MANVVLLHSAYGLRPAVLADAQRLRSAGHQVVTPDLYDGAVFDDLTAGLAERNRIGWPELLRRAEQAVKELPAGQVFAGWSLGGGIAHQLARSQPGAAALLLLACDLQVDANEALILPVQVHAATGDSWIDEADVAEAELMGAEVFRYRGGHLFADEGLADYDAASAALLWERVREFLSR